MNIQYYKLRLLGCPFRCGGGGGGGGGDGSDAAAATGVSGAGASDAAAATGSSSSVGDGTVGGDVGGGGDSGVGPGFSTGFTDTGTIGGNADTGGAPGGGTGESTSPIAGIASTANLTGTQAAVAATTLSNMTGMDTMDAMMSVTNGFGTAPGLSAEGPAHSSGVSMADIAVAAALGLGNTDVTSNQTVSQAIAAAATHASLNANIGQIVGVVTGNPALGAIATAANAVAQGHSLADVAATIGMSVVATAISQATGIAISSQAVAAIASGNIGQAAVSVAIGQVASQTGLSIPTVTAALSGNLGAAIANQTMAAVISSTAEALSVSPSIAATLGQVTGMTPSAQASIASAINSNSVVSAVNSVTSSVANAVASSGMGVTGGTAGIGGAVATSPSSGTTDGASTGTGAGAGAGGEGSGDASGGAGGSFAQQVINGIAAKQSNLTPEQIYQQLLVKQQQQQNTGPSTSDIYWGNLFGDLSREYAGKPATPTVAPSVATTADKIQEAMALYQEQSGQELPAEYFLSYTGDWNDLKKSVDDLYTTKPEARQLWEKQLGYRPSDFDLMELEGLSGADAQRVIDDRGSVTQEEAAQLFKDIYGETYKPTTDELLGVMGGNEAVAKNLVVQQYNEYATDKNAVTNDELTSMLQKAGLKEEDLTESQLLSALKTTEAGAETYLQRLADIKETTFDGSEYKSQVEAQNAAIKNGYNTYTWDGKSYTLMSKEQATQFQADRASGKNVGVTPDIITPLPGKTLEQQLAEAGNPDSYAYWQGDHLVMVITAKRMTVPDYEDSEAWAAFKAEKDALGGDNYASWLTEKFSILEQAMKKAPEGSAAKFLANAAMWGYGKIADLATTMIGVGKAMGLSDGTVAENVAKQVNNWSQKLVDQGIQNAEAAVGANIAAVTKETIAAEKGVKPSDISDAELYAKKSLALAKQVVDNPLGVGLFVSGEAIQEIPFLAASAGMGAVFRSVAGKAVGASAALGTDVALNGAESFGGNYNEVRDYLIKKGVDPEKANALATQSGLEAMGVGMLTAYVGDRKLVQAFMGDLSTDSLGKLLLTNSTKEWMLGNVEGYLQNASAQIGKYGEFKSTDEAMNAGIMEGLAQKAIATGVITADKLSQVVVAKDSDGNNVMYKDIIDGSKTFDPSTIDKSVSFGAGLNLGDAIGYHSTFATNPDISPDEYFYTAQAFRDNGLTDFSSSDIAAAVGGVGELSNEDINKFVVPYADERVVTPEEARQAFMDIGYTPTDEEVSDYSGQKDQQSTLSSITQKYSPLATTADEARAMLQNAGYANPTNEEIQQFVGNKSEADTSQSVQQYVDTHTVTRDEAEQFFKSIGYTPTEEEINQFVGQGQNIAADTVKSQVESYVDPRYVSQDEVTAAYEKLGLSKPTDADLQALVGQYAETDLAGKAEKSLDTARYNSIMAQLDSMSAGADPATKEAIEKVKEDLNNKLVDLGVDVNELVGDLAGQIAAAKTDAQSKYDALKEAIADAKAAGLEGDAALQDAIDKVATDLGTTKADLLTQLGTTETNLKTEFATQLGEVQTQIGDVSADLQTKFDSLTDQQRALATQLQQQGVDLATAIEQAKSQTQQQIEEVSADVQAKYDALSADQKALADQLRQQGVDFNSAIDQAKAQTTTQIAGLSAEMQAKYDALTADQRALADQLHQQGADLNTAINTAAASIQADVQAKYDALNAGQKVLADQLAQQGVDLKTAIDVASQQTQQQVVDLGASLNQRVDELVQQGVDQYSATQQAIAEVTQQNQQLQNLIGTQGRTANQSDIDALTQMLGGQRAVDLSYDVTGDKQITQDDINFLQNIVTGANVDWPAPTGSPWAATGLYGQIQANEIQRQADLAEAARLRLADQQALEQQRQDDIARANEAERRSAIRTTAGTAQNQLQSLMSQLPTAYKAAQQTTTPIYAGEIQDFNLGSPLDVGFFGVRKEAQTGQNKQQTTKIATGGYLDDLLDLLR